MAPDGVRPLDKLAGLEWRVSQPYRLQIAAFNPRPVTARLGWLRIEVRDQEGRPATDPIFYLLGANPLPGNTGDLHEVVFITPLTEGSYNVVGELMAPPGDPVPLFSFPIAVNLAERLRNMKAELEVPGTVPAKSSAPLKLRLTSELALKTQDELELLTRFRQVGGDYVWELDRLPTPLNLDLAEGGTQEVEWNIIAPWREGTYDLELEILDKTTGERLPVQLPGPARITVQGG
jgi:hypothetical protein